ncbi:hypothetical protein BsWGS_10678 [Bradybaena similaris]
MSGTFTAHVSKEPDSQDLFMPEFKRLKARNPPPDLSTVVDLNQHDLSSSVGHKVISRYPIRCCDLKPVAGLKPCQEWTVVQFLDYPGLLVIQNPFTDGYQRYWVYRCLQSFPADKDNVTNLTALGDSSSQDLWQQFVHRKCQTFEKHDPLRKLRWTTLGYHYNWTTKEYSEDSKATFPSDVACLSQYFAACLGFAQYQAEAAIVNYYHLDSTLAGHTDHSEVDHSAPLFSISFGQTAIFLLGGSTKSMKPVSVFLRSGDVCVMSGQCRLAYHAVPRILAPTSEEPLMSLFSQRHVHLCPVSDSIALKSSNCEFPDDVVKNDKTEHRSKAVSSTGNKPSTDFMESTHSHLGHCQNTEVGHRATDLMNTGDHLQCKTYTSSFEDYDDHIDKVNSNIEKAIAALDFHPFLVYLRSSRINLNIRQVLPPGVAKLPDKGKLQSINNSCDFHNESLCPRLIKRDVHSTSDCSIDQLGSDVGGHDRFVSAAVQRCEEMEDVYLGMDVTKKIKMHDSAS